MTEAMPRWTRIGGATLARGVCVLFLPVIAVCAGLTGASFAVSVAAACALSALGVISGRFGRRIGGFVLATVLIAQAMLLTAVFAGHPWQPDTLVVFVALLAVVAAMDRVDLLIWACALAVLHHIGVVFILPSLVDPAIGLAAMLERTGLYSAILVGTCLVLTQSMWKRQAALRELRDTAARLETESRLADDAGADARQARADADRAVMALRVALTRVAGRDLASALETELPGQYEVARAEFNQTIEMLREAFLAANALAETFTTDSQNLARATQEMSRRTAAQAGNLGRVSATAESLLGSVGDTAQQARDAAGSASEARQCAEQGSTVTTQAIDAMRDIEASSRRISQIVDLIDDVSFQTNLLALNAGVEAARVGDAGKGFAVVADEVRQLAQSTSEAASDIKQLIKESSDQVAAGADLVQSMGQCLAEITTEITHASGLTDGISAANADHLAALTELSGLVREAFEGTQAAAGQGEELQVMARRISVTSKKLSGDIEAFTLTESDLALGAAQAAG